LTVERFEVNRGVGIATLVSYALSGATSIALGQGVSSDDIDREWRVALGFAYLLHFATYCSWTSGAIGGVGFASVYAYRTRCALSASRWRTRVFVGLGAAMSALTMVLLLPDIMMVLTIIFVASTARGTSAREYVLPESFRGTATV